MIPDAIVCYVLVFVPIALMVESSAPIAASYVSIPNFDGNYYWSLKTWSTKRLVICCAKSRKNRKALIHFLINQSHQI